MHVSVARQVTAHQCASYKRMNETQQHTWQEANQEYLMSSLRLVRDRLDGSGNGNGTVADHDEEVDRRKHLEQAVRDADSRLPSPSALDHLCSLFGLSTFERDLLLLAAGPELDAGFAAACRRAGALPPTPGLALSVLADPHWSGITPSSPLRRWHLISLGNADRLTDSPVRIEEPLLHYLAGVPCVDERLLSLTREVHPGMPLAASQERCASRALALWEMDRSNGERLPVLRLRGADRRAPFGIAATVCDQVGLSLRSIPARFLPSAPAELDLFCRLFERDAALHSLALLVDCSDVSGDESGISAAVHRLVEEAFLPLFIVGEMQMRPVRRTVASFDVAKPEPKEQQSLWRQAFHETHPDLQADRLATQFNLSAETIYTVAAEGRALHGAGQEQHAPIEDRLWDLCRAYQRPGLDELAQRIEPASEWDDLILPEKQKAVLKEMVIHARNQNLVYRDWGFARKGERGLGITALFAGQSGTGKTMAAEILAQQLQLDLYRIDLSAIISKYIGETEKNLGRVFDAADEGGCLLLFDEADAIFGKRSEVKDSHDRYANIEVSYLLQRLESYRGMAVLTTNMKSAVDSAFLRRLRFLVNFPFPDPESRVEIWRRAFPPSAPTEGLDPDRLARLNVTGGHIRNIAMAAAFLAADAGQPIRMDHLLAAARSEMIKIEKSITASEVKGWA